MPPAATGHRPLLLAMWALSQRPRPACAGAAADAGSPAAYDNAVYSGGYYDQQAGGMGLPLGPDAPTYQPSWLLKRCARCLHDGGSKGHVASTAGELHCIHTGLPALQPYQLRSLRCMHASGTGQRCGSTVGALWHCRQHASPHLALPAARLALPAARLTTSGTAGSAPHHTPCSASQAQRGSPRRAQRLPAALLGG